MVLLQSWFQKRIFWAFQKSILKIFANISVRQSKLFFGKVSQGVKNCLNQNLAIGSFLRYGFEAALSSKKKVFNLWKGYFSVFGKYFSDEVETIFWESEANCLKMFQSKFGHRKLVRKWLWSYLDLKNQCSDRLKRAFFSFVQILEWRSLNHFLEKISKALKTVYI